MDNKLKIGLIAAAVAVVAIIVFNFLPGSIRSAGTIGFLAGGSIGMVFTLVVRHHRRQRDRRIGDEQANIGHNRGNHSYDRTL